MITLEQVKLLETKVSKAIDTIQHLTDENKLLREKLAGYQGRINELEVLVERFKEDQSKIEAGIISALDRLNQFEDVLELEISEKNKSETVETSVPTKTPLAPLGDHQSEAEALDSDSDEAILAILEQEKQARQGTETAPEASENREPFPGAELDIF